MDATSSAATTIMDGDVSRVFRGLEFPSPTPFTTHKYVDEAFVDLRFEFCMIEWWYGNTLFSA